ncbi:hypothetical protein C1645_817427 [Glomus cerebriforme]|uniref:Uncharacterized protein n=1 Tax=Glomus cerebriforme TaxID=658196 RepID=A0A397TAE6_9GLOM|nr:hypothetical protein C1645_817427 [Glomus cerebriforme]
MGFGQFWTVLDKFWTVQNLILDSFGQSKTHRNFGQFWIVQNCPIEKSNWTSPKPTTGLYDKYNILTTKDKELVITEEKAATEDLFIVKFLKKHKSANNKILSQSSNTNTHQEDQEVYEDIDTDESFHLTSIGVLMQYIKRSVDTEENQDIIDDDSYIDINFDFLPQKQLQDIPNT